MVWTFAQAIGEQVERVGAYAGFAAFFGLALLAILYFAQARELKRLRDWAGRAPERARELEERAMAQEAAGGVPAPPPAPGEQAGEPAEPAREEPRKAPTEVPAGPAPATAAGRTAASPGAAAAAGGTAGAAAATAPAGSGPDGNGFVPPPEGQDEVPGAATPDEEPASAAGPQPPAAQPPSAPATAPGQGPPVLPGEDEPAGPEEHPAEDEDDFDSDTSDSPAIEPEVARARAHPAPVRSGRPRQGAVPLRASAPAAKLPPRRPSPVTPKARRRRLVPASGSKIAGAALAVLALGGGAAAIFGTGGGGDDATRPDTTVAGTQPTETPAPDRTDRIDRAGTTVAVLNGTTTNGLAASLVEKLTSAGYEEGPRGNNADQQRATSVVLFQDGARAEARDVGRLLEIDEVRQMDEAQTADTGDAQVVVIAGLDQAP